MQRKLLDDHLQLCPLEQSSFYHRPAANQDQVSPAFSSPIDANEATAASNTSTVDTLYSRLHYLEHDLTLVRNALNEETRHRHRLIADVGLLRHRHAVDDAWTQKVGDVLGALKLCLGEESLTRQTDVQQLRDDITALAQSYAETEAWRSAMNAQLERLESEMFAPEDDDETDGTENNVRRAAGSSWRSYIDVLMTDQRSAAMRTYELQNELQLLRQRADDAQRLAATNEALLSEKCAHIDEFLVGQRADRRALQRRSLHETTAVGSSGFGIGKLATLDFELKSLKHICTSTEDKCDRLEQIVRDVRKTVMQCAQQLAERAEQVTVQRQIGAIENMQGHLVWRMSCFAAKWQAAKEDVDVGPLHSPLFCDRQYGYTLRLDVYLNGRGTWRGRNVLACLSVVSGGQWDALLTWPCKLRAEIRIREQPTDGRAAQDVCKTIVARGSVDADEQAQYIFITHKTLKRGEFVRDDAVFFEVRVQHDVAGGGVE